MTSKAPFPGAGAGGSCPECGRTGRRVGAVTLGALLAAPARERAGDLEGYRFCRTVHCGVVYFSERTGARFCTRDVSVPVFQKSAEPSRPVCYCFDHTVAAVQEDVARTGRSAIPDSIAEKCRQGLERCAEANPQGVCCLGNLGEIVRAAAAFPLAAPAEASLRDESCVLEPAGLRSARSGGR